MAQGRLSTLRAILAPRIVKVVGGIFASLYAYDVLSNQLEFPTIRALLRKIPPLQDRLAVSGTLLPWWGWLLVLQAVFIYALFEYVRRNVPITGDTLTNETKRDINLDLANLLYFAVNQATVALLDGMIEAAPKGGVPGGPDRPV